MQIFIRTDTISLVRLRIRSKKSKRGWKLQCPSGTGQRPIRTSNLGCFRGFSHAIERISVCELPSTPDAVCISPRQCGYIHLKYCKPDPYENWSPDFSAAIRSGIVPGPVVPDELRSLVTSIGTSF